MYFKFLCLLLACIIHASGCTTSSHIANRGSDNPSNHKTYNSSQSQKSSNRHMDSAQQEAPQDGSDEPSSKQKPLKKTIKKTMNKVAIAAAGYLVAQVVIALLLTVVMATGNR